MRLLEEICASALMMLFVGSSEAQNADRPIPGGRPPLLLLSQEPLTAPSPGSMEGLPKDATFLGLTWERACTLALIRSREKRRPLTARLDPKVIDEQAAGSRGHATETDR